MKRFTFFLSQRFFRKHEMDNQKVAFEPIHIDKKLILLGVEALDKKTVIDSLGNLLLENGYVKEGFTNAVLEREEKFATVLPTSIPVAIPHTDPPYCLIPTISIAVLNHPVLFGEMGSNGKQVRVRMVFLLSLTGSSNPVGWLSKLVDFFANDSQMESLLSVKNLKNAAILLRSGLLGGTPPNQKI